MNRRYNLLLCAATILLASVGVAAADLPVPPAPKPEVVPASLQVLVIGDSNTESGMVTGEVARIFESKYGYFGSGYHSLSAGVGMGQGYLPYLRIANVGEWEAYDMYPPSATAVKPYISPDGSCARSSKTGDTTEVYFYGTCVDLYWLAGPNGGNFSIMIDDKNPQKIATKSDRLETRRTHYENLTPAWHKLVATAYGGDTVTLLGVDARVDARSKRRAVVDKWGNSSVSLFHFLDIDKRVFDSALKALHPNIVAIFLGTNDHLRDRTTPEKYAKDMTAFVERIREALPHARVLVCSTLDTLPVPGAAADDPSSELLKGYVKVLPGVAKSCGVAYWDLNGWFGTWEDNNKAGLMANFAHPNQQGAEKIAARFYEVLMETTKNSARRGK